MGYRLSKDGFNKVLHKLSEDYTVFAPKFFAGGGNFSDTDLIRYGEISVSDEIEFNKKAALSFKETLLPITQVLFYFTEEQVTESAPPPKGAVVFLRSCDLHAIKRLDDIYLANGAPDYYYKRVRDNIRFVLIGCQTPFENCFCVDMGTNRADTYDFSIHQQDGEYLIDCKNDDWQELFDKVACESLDVTPAFVSETPTRVSIAQNLTADVASASFWDEYDARCVNCGRCNFSCPTCTCYTMQDIFYTDNAKVGERRRIWASCMVDGFTDVAGGGSYRKKNSQRMRFKTLHKALDYKQRFGVNMCVGCGRCDDVCPEYISFSHILNRLEEAMEEVRNNAK